MTHHRLNGGLRGLFFGLAGFAALIAATSCGGGGGGGPVRVFPAPTQTSAPAGTAVVQFVITWPVKAPGSSVRRRPAYLSKSTASITIAINGGTPVVANSPSPSGSPLTTTVTVNAPIGPDTFAVDDYDGTGGTGNLLADNVIPFTVVIDEVNMVPITLNGNLGKVACAPIAPFVTGTAPTLTMIGPAGQVALLPEDADANIIIAPGAIPALTLSANPAQATVTPAPTSNEFNVNIIASPGPAITLTGSGQDLAGKTVTGTCTIARELAMYVANHSLGGASPSISIYAASATTATSPIATISGSNTKLAAIQFVAVDPKGDIFVSNEGPAPGATTTYSPTTSGYVSIYGPGPGSNGNPSPIATIPALDTPEGLGFDSSNRLYVLSIDRIGVYPANADGVTGPAETSAVIAAPSPPPSAAPSPSATPGLDQTDLYSCYGLALDSSNNIYTACSDVLNEFPAGSSGNVAPAEILAIGATSMSFTSDSWLDVAVDSSGNIYAPASNNNLNLVDIYAADSGANPAATPVPTIAKSVSFSQPLGVFVDPNNAIYVANFGNSTVNVFANMTELETGAGAVIGATYSSGINGPYGVYVR